MDYTMASTEEPVKHSPPPASAKRPRGILKNSFQKSPPVSPTTGETPMSDKELTILNTQVNAGHRRSSSSASHPRRPSSRTPSYSGDVADEENSQRLKWDEANLYLTEQERTSTMKIDEPKTPYAKHYDPAEDPSDDEYISTNDLAKPKVNNKEEDIPGLSLGEPEEAVPEGEFGSIKRSNTGRVHVDDAGSGHDDDELSGLSAEEREKHRRFEQMRKKHYEMKNVAKLLGHPEIIDQEDEDGDVPVPIPAVPAVPFNGLAK